MEKQELYDMCKSIIRNILAETYKELYDKETTIKKVNACMEGGILSNNIQNLDICTIAPTIENWPFDK